METIFAILLLGLLYIGLLSPILCSSYLALFKGKGIQYRWLFPIITVISVYTLTLSIYIGAAIIISPLYSHILSTAPIYMESGRELPLWMPIVIWLVDYDYDIYAISLFIMSLWVTKIFWPYWATRFKINA